MQKRTQTCRLNRPVAHLPAALDAPDAPDTVSLPARAQRLSRLRLSCLQLSSIGAALALAGWVIPAQAQNPPLEPQLDVGVVQRFGSSPQDEVILKPAAGDSLTVKFKLQDQPQTLTTTSDVKLKLEMQQQSDPKVTERVILSTHRSFESAEDSASQWKTQGIEVEVAQPRQWQVWAKRDTYKTPLLRRLLMQNLQSNGSRTAFIDTQVQTQIPKAAVVINGTSYQQDNLEFGSTSNRVEVTFNREEHGTRSYAGSLKLQPNAYGTYTLVNQVPLETYLRGVVPHEIGSGAPPTTVEAQAVLARTYALRNLRRFAIDNYQICADTQCQVYWGLGGATPEADRAIAATRGKVLTYGNELIDALYSSTTGGVTAPFSNVWNGPDRPYLRAVVDSVQNIWSLPQRSLSEEANFRSFIGLKQGFNEDGWDMFRWRVESPLSEIAQDLRAYLQSKQHPLANFTQVKDLRVLKRSPAGRVQKMEVTTDRGLVQLEKDEILRALYAPNSTLFYLDPVYEAPAAKASVTKPEAQAGVQASVQADSPNPANQDAKLDDLMAQASPSPSPSLTAPEPSPAPKILKGFTFVGGGLGHGVGMSQTGAYRLGKLGWSHEQILSFYYPDTQLQPLNPTITFWKEPEDAEASEAQ